ncbi:unnamed protein product, partial [Cuscuta campestris]
KFEKAFDRFEDVESNYITALIEDKGIPSHDDWEIGKNLSIFLERFYNLTKRVSGSLYVTSNVYLEEICDVYCTLNAWARSEDEQFKDMSLKMLDKYDKYWGDVEKMNMLLYIAAVLDPRYKFDYVEFCFKKMYSQEVAEALHEKVKSTMDELFVEYKKMADTLGNTSSAQTTLTPQSSLNTLSATVDSNTISETSTKNEFRKYKSSTVRGGQKSDLDKYITDEFDEDEDSFDILGWWKKNGHRSSLTPKIVQALICSQDWLRQGAYCSIHEFESEVSELDKLDEDLSKLKLDPVIDA